MTTKGDNEVYGRGSLAKKKCVLSCFDLIVGFLLIKVTEINRQKENLAVQSGLKTNVYHVKHTNTTLRISQVINVLHPAG